MNRRFLFPALAALLLVLSPAAVPSGAGAASSLDSGGRSGSQQRQAPSIDNSGVCSSTHSFSSGITSFLTCFTADGNVAEFNVGGPGGPFELIRAGTIAEGYAVCSTVGGVSGSDVAGLGETGFNNPTVVQPGGPNTFPLTITRTTTDGRFSLKQTFLATAARVVTVTMSLTNTSGADLAGVKLTRIADTDIGASLGDDLAVNTRRTITAFDNPNGAQLTLTATTRGRPVTTSVGPYPSDAATCANLGGASVLGPGDVMGKVVYNLGTVNHGDTRVVAVTYSGD